MQALQKIANPIVSKVYQGAGGGEGGGDEDMDTDEL